MATENMSSKDIKNILINTFKKSAEKSVQDAKYDKTILATIQYCTDATIGQYKIKYQNGYYTAYDHQNSTIYLNGTLVYVLVPGNNMNNRMFITGTASNDNRQKVYISSLEGDQQYYCEGSNYIQKLTSSTKHINMSTYDAPNKQWVKTLYNASDDKAECLVLIDHINDYLKTADFIRIGAKFQTTITESRRNSGNYGLIFKFKYKSNTTKQVYYKDFVLDTYTMTGTPFNFTVPMPQYLYFELPPEHKSEFISIASIKEFVEYFPTFEQSEVPEDKYDIKISDLSLHKAVKLYDTNNDKYKLAIISEDNFNFSGGDGIIKNSINCTAELRVNGNSVTELSGQNVEYYWAKEDVTVDNVNHAKYNQYTGKGWYCLNKSSKRKYNEETISQLQNYTITQDDTGTPNEFVIWDTNAKQIKLSKKLFSGKLIRLKCVARYENTTITSEIKEVINPEGYYLILSSENNKISSSNGRGNFTLTAGVFKDGVGAPISYSMLLNDNEEMLYEWVEIDSLNNVKKIPSKQSEDILLSQPAWNKNEDNETKTDTEVATYLAKHDTTYAVCVERYDYYDDKFTLISNQLSESSLTPAEKQDLQTKLQRCQTRRDNIITTKMSYINTLYKDGIHNNQYYIFGPSETVGEYTAVPNDYKNAGIQTVNYYYYNIENYNTHKHQYNTLLKLPANKIKTNVTYKVSALLHDKTTGVSQSIGTETITLTDNEQPSTRYELEIVHGDNSFIYDVSGYQPKVSCLPLTFKLYDNKNNHNLIYDSSLADDDQEYNATMLHPEWIFYNNSIGMLNTKYVPNDTNCKVSSEDNRQYILMNVKAFYYYLANTFNENKRNLNNVVLRITLNDETVTASTNFLFLKQGDLNTNGTDLVLSIKNSNYESYKDNILSSYNTFDQQNVNPDARHLQNSYLYGTMCYDGNGNALADVRSAHYVNLQFIKAVNINSTPGFIGSDSIQLYGQWWQNGQNINIDDDSIWTFEDGTDEGTGSSRTIFRDYYGQSCYLAPPLTIEPNGPQCTVKIKYTGATSSGVGIAYKPSKIENIEIGTDTYDYKISNNTVKLKAETEVMQGQNNDMIKRTNYGYYNIPYFYFNYTGTRPMPDNIDPARHIVITGGFDEVKYDSSGINPEYNKQEPFCFHIFDEDNNDITEEILKSIGVAGHNTVIKWTFSKGFTSSNSMTPSKISQIENFEDIDDSKSLLYTYCKYKNNYYKCITDHTKSQTIKVEKENKTYEPGEFVTPYWEEINVNAEAYQKCTIKPFYSYETLAQTDLFNSWISLFVQYKKGSTVYQAEAVIPINVFCNKYGSQEINNWDGKKTIVGDSYIISSKIAAGVKENNNVFRGITLGTSFYNDNNERGQEIGLFGYGLTDKNNPNSWARTMFIDADSGRAIFGPSGASQIILDPRVPDNPTTTTRQIWSRIAGWYISNDYFYKPVGAAFTPLDSSFNSFARGQALDPGEAQYGSVGMYCPSYKETSDKDIWLWADNTNKDYTSKQNARFRVTYGGHLYCADIEAEGTIRATSGYIGNSVNGVYINWADSSKNPKKNYILYNKNFRIENKGNNEASVYINGTIMAKSGQIGRVRETATGEDSGILFIEYPWYPWHLPANDEPWNDDTFYLDKTKGLSQTYALYNKNFFITNQGEAFFNGKLFTKSGRIGDWVISDSKLQSIDENVYLSSTSGLRLGSFYAYPSGAIGNSGNWWITADGRASFENVGNSFVGSRFSTPGGSTLDEHGLNLAVGEQMGIGNTYLAAGENGFILHGGISVTDPSTFSSTVTFNESAYFGGSSGAVTINNSGINFGGPSGRYKIFTSGNAELNAVNVQSLTINNTALTDYIRSYVLSSEIMNTIASRLTGGFTYKSQDWDAVKGTAQNVTIGYFPTT